MKRLTPAFAYLRVSGKGQIDGDGFTRQLTAIRAYAKTHGLEIIEVFEERGVTGTKELDNRPALQAVLTALASGTVKHVCIEKLDRLARDLMIQESILADFRKQGYELVSTCEPDLCSNDASRILIRQILGAFAQYEKSMIVSKLRAARERMKMRTGKCEGRKAFGARDGEADTLARMTALRSAGASYQAIADTLASEGRKPRYGERWNVGVINQILHAQSALSRNMVANAAVQREASL